MFDKIVYFQKSIIFVRHFIMINQARRNEKKFGAGERRELAVYQRMLAAMGRRLRSVSNEVA